MQVENIECQIAQAQIGHYIAGSGLSPEAMSQLEEHIARCADCKDVLREKRTELRAMLVPEKAAVDFEAIAREAEATKPNSFASALRKKSLQQMLEPAQELPFVYQARSVTEAVAIQETKVEESAPQPEVLDPEVPEKAKKPARASSWKPLAYSLALAAVLVGMSLFSGNISEVLGPKLSQADPATETPKLLASSTDVRTESTATDANPAEATAASANPAPANPPAEVPQGSEPAGPASESELAVPSIPQPNPEDTAGTSVASALGASSGALATTQFESIEPEVQTPTPTPPKVVANAPAKAVVRRAPSKRVNRKRVARRTVARKSPARSAGIKVYNP